MMTYTVTMKDPTPVTKQKLGSEYVTDFIIGERHSYGFNWVAVELESPKAKLFTRKGDPTRELTHAIRQIHDWRSWIKSNRDYATKEKNKKGLGLTDIDSKVKGLILIGRRKDVDKSTDELRREMVQSSAIDIHTYDYLIDSARLRVKWCEERRKKQRTTH